MSIDF